MSRNQDERESWQEGEGCERQRRIRFPDLEYGEGGRAFGEQDQTRRGEGSGTSRGRRSDRTEQKDIAQPEDLFSASPFRHKCGEVQDRAEAKPLGEFLRDIRTATHQKPEKGQRGD